MLGDIYANLAVVVSFWSFRFEPSAPRGPKDLRRRDFLRITLMSEWVMKGLLSNKKS